MNLAPILLLATALHARIAPDGGEILTVIDGSVWRIAKGATEVAKGSNPRWAPGGRTFAYIKDGELWIDDGKRRLASPHSIQDYLWSPDGKSIAAIGGGQIHLIDVASGKARQLTNVAFTIIASPWHPDGNLSWSPDGRRIAFAGKPTPKFDDEHRSDVYAVDLDGNVAQLTTRDGMDQRPAWSPDGKWIAFRTTFGRYDRYANHGLAIVAANGGAIRDVGAAMELGFLDGPYWHEWSADSKSIYFLASHRAAIHLFALDVGSRGIRAITKGDAAHLRPSLNARRDIVAFLRSDPGTPWDIWQMPLDGVPVRRTRLNPQLESDVRFERVRWKASDGMEMEGILATAPGARGKLPVVVYLHGGPEGMIFHALEPEVPIPGIEPMVIPPPYYAARGWAVFLPNFRGSGGYGERHRRAAMIDWSRGFADDVLSGIDALAAAGRIDPERLFLAGSWRSGSTKVISLLTQTKRFRAAASFSAYPDVEALARSRDDFQLQHQALFGGEWKKHSPIHRAGDITTPLLLVHDEHDFIRSEQTMAVHRILNEKGVAGELILYRTRDAAGDAELVERVFRWFARW